jgi:hypothetical protein
MLVKMQSTCKKGFEFCCHCDVVKKQQVLQQNPRHLTERAIVAGKFAVRAAAVANDA